MSFLEEVLLWYEGNMNYISIFVLMVVESSFIPFPSEVVIPPAVYVAESSASSLCQTGIYILDVAIIVIIGTIGATVGAIINYYLAYFIGRPIVYSFSDSRIGKMLLLSSEKVQRAEEYFNKKGNVSTFVGRLIPGIRQLISIPAGLCKMQLKFFLLYTIAGALLWNTILAIVGYIANGQKDMIERYSQELSIGILAIFAIALVVWIIKNFRPTPKKR